MSEDPETATADPARILVIDDDVTVRRAMARVLAREGYAVQEVDSAEAGLRWFRANRVDLVITDIQMPGKNGLEVILELRSLNPTLPVIAVSGGDYSKELDLLGSAEVMGAVALVFKPFTVEELSAAVRAALGRAEAA